MEAHKGPINTSLFLICTEQKPIKLKVVLKSAKFTEKMKHLQKKIQILQKSVKFTKKD